MRQSVATNHIKPLDARSIRRLEASSKPPLSPARQALADAMTALEELRSQQHDASERQSAARQAGSDLVAAESAWRAFLFEDELADEPDQAARARLKSAVLDARERIKDQGDADAAVARLEHQSGPVVAEVGTQINAVIADEAAALASKLHHHERLALKYRALIDRLVYAIQQKQALHKTGTEPYIALAALSVSIQKSLLLDPDVGKHNVMAHAAREAAYAAADGVAVAFFDAIQTDPDATIPHPEA